MSIGGIFGEGHVYEINSSILLGENRNVRTSYSCGGKRFLLRGGLLWIELYRTDDRGQAIGDATRQRAERLVV